MSMNKAQLVEKIQAELGGDTSKASAERALAAVLDCIKAGVKKEKSVQLIGFGTFEVKSRKARKGINPKTGETIQIKASKTIGFKPGAAFKDML